MSQLQFVVHRPLAKPRFAVEQIKILAVVKPKQTTGMLKRIFIKEYNLLQSIHSAFSAFMKFGESGPAVLPIHDCRFTFHVSH